MKPFACLIRHDTAVRIYISIQLRKHHVRSLSTNVSKRGNLKFQSSAWQTSPMGPRRKKGVTDHLEEISPPPVIYHKAQLALLLKVELFGRHLNEQTQSWWWIPFIHLCFCHPHVTPFMLTFYCHLLSLYFKPFGFMLRFLLQSVRLVVVRKVWVLPTCVSRLIVNVLLCVSPSGDILPPIVSSKLSFNTLLTSAVLIRFVLNELYILTFSGSKILCPLGEHANHKKMSPFSELTVLGFLFFFTLVISETPVNIGKAAWKRALVLPLCVNVPEFPPLLIGPGANKHGSITGSFDSGVNVD